MGTNTLTPIVGGTILPADVNQIITAVENNFVPRNNSGVPTNRAGSLGSPSLSWDKIYGTRLFLGGLEISGDPERVSPNEVVSGTVRTGTSGQGAYLVPAGVGTNVTILGTTVNLQADINRSLFTLLVDLIKVSATGPAVANTCLINDATAVAQTDTRTWGEALSEKEFITVDTMGANITSQINHFVALKVTGTNEIMMAFVASATQLTNISRGFFYDSSINPIKRGVLSDNVVLTRLALNWIFLKNDSTAILLNGPVNDPVWSATQPAAPALSDRWYDLTNQTWKIYNGATFVVSNEVLIGWCATDTANCIAARCIDFAANHKEDNTIVLGNKTNTTLECNRIFSTIRVHGRSIEYKLSRPVFNITNQLAASNDMYLATEQASTRYYLYITENGDLKISDFEPYYRGDFYAAVHPHQQWRCVGYAQNDAGSNFSYFSYYPSSFFEREIDVTSGVQIGTALTTIGAVSAEYPNATGTWTVNSGSAIQRVTVPAAGVQFTKRGFYEIKYELGCHSSTAGAAIVNMKVQDVVNAQTIKTFPDRNIQGGTTLRTALTYNGLIPINRLNGVYQFQMTRNGAPDSIMDFAGVYIRRLDTLYV